MFVDGAAIAVLHPVDQSGLHPLTAIGEHRIGRNHLIQRGFLTAERVRQQGREVVVNAETLRIAADHIHPDLLRQTDGHQVARLFDARTQGRRPIEFMRGVLRPPNALRRVDLNRGVDHDGRGAIATVERGGIDEGLKARPRLALGLCGPVEHARLIGKAALHRDHAARVHVHRDETALHLWHLPQSPADERSVAVRGHAPDQDDLTHLKQVARHLSLAPQRAVI